MTLSERAYIASVAVVVSLGVVGLGLASEYLPLKQFVLLALFFGPILFVLAGQCAVVVVVLTRNMRSFRN